MDLPPRDRRPNTFEVFRAQRAIRAERAARSSSDREILKEALSGWRFAEDPAMLSLLWETVKEAPLSPTPLACALSFAPLPALPEPSDDMDPELAADLAADLTELQHRERLASAWRDRAPKVEVDPIVWAIDALSWLGEQAEHLERGAWLRVPWRASASDGSVAAMWSGLSSGSFFRDRAAWMELLQGDVVAVFRTVADAQKLPPDVGRRMVADLRDVLPYKLAPSSDGYGGLSQVGVRMIETGSLGPLPELLSALSEEGRKAASACISRRGHWPDTLTALFPSSGPVERAVRAAPFMDPDRGEVLLDLHVAMRLVERWRSEGAGDPTTDWSVVIQNRGRSRGRLRALLCEESGGSVGDRVAHLPAVAARTRAAARRWAWEWAWEELALDFSFDAARPVGVPCKATGALHAALEGEEIAILSVWVLRVVLRNRASHLLRWVAEGSTGDHDATWGRLLLDIPDALRDGPQGRYGRVRAHLASSLDGILSGYRPLFAALASLPDDRTAMARFRTLTEPIWHPAVPAIASGMPGVRRSAAEALALTARTPPVEDT